MRDTDIDALFTLATTDGILPLVRQTARFNQHRDFILALLRHQPARRALFGRLASSDIARRLATRNNDRISSDAARCSA